MLMTIASVPGTGVLNAIGHGILDFLDYRIVSLAILVAVLVLWPCKRLRAKRNPTRDECLHVVEGGVSIAMALFVGAVFLLTDPPAIDRLPHESRAIVGLFAMIILFTFGLERLGRPFKER